MSSREDLLASISHTTRDYRVGALPAPRPEHVDRWVQQFNEAVQLPILTEMEHVIKRTYFSRKRVANYLQRFIQNKKLAGENPCDFWKKVNFLTIQQQGHSQIDLLSLFDKELEAECGFSTQDCNESNNTYIYLDDVMFSGNRVGNDLEKWVRDTAPNQATVIVMLIVTHKLARWQIEKRLKSVIKETNKNIKGRWLYYHALENRKNYRMNAGVLWPSKLPDDNALNKYLERPHKYPFEPRMSGGKLGPFSSESGRQLLEREFTLAGVHIRNFAENPNDIIRPLGFSPFGLGFGSMIVTFRNCPNNCPLALWWGDPNASSNHPFSKWYPLFPRVTYD